MQLIKSRTLMIYLLILLCLFVFYVIIVLSNQEIILSKLQDIFKRRYNVYSKAFLFFTMMPFIFLSGVIVSLLIHYNGKIVTYFFKDDTIEIKTRQLNIIIKKEIIKLLVSEEESKVVKIVFVTHNNQYSIYRVDEDFLKITTNYFQLHEEDEIKKEFNTKMMTKIYKLTERGKI